MSIIIVDKSTRALTAAQVALSKTITELNSGVELLVQQQQELATDLHFKGEELKAVSAKVEAAEREAAAEIRLRVLENSNTVLEELLTERGLITTTADVQTDLQDALKEAQQKAAQTEHEAVKAAETALHSHYASKLASQVSDHKVATAELNANAKAYITEIAMLKTQLNQAHADIKSEREARVQIAQAEAQKQGVTVNTAK